MSFQNKIKTVFNTHGFTLSSLQAEQFEIFYNLLIQENQKVNLTAITEENEVIEKHFLDSILPSVKFAANASVIDVGAGAGLPGIALKIFRPDLNIVLLDSLNKRVTFMNMVIKTLNLSGITAVHFRSEDAAKRPEHREKHNYAIARAVAKLNTLLEYCAPFVKVGGAVIAYKARTAEEEVVLAKNSEKELGLTLQTVFNITNAPASISERTFIIYNKTSATPIKYPRVGNKPKTNPL